MSTIKGMKLLYFLLSALLISLSARESNRKQIVTKEGTIMLDHPVASYLVSALKAAPQLYVARKAPAGKPMA